MMRFRHPPAGASLSSHWLAQALSTDGPHAPALRGATRADVCIVGGGYTGLWTAIELKQRDPSIDVVVLEAQICGGGASGTNAGMLMNLWPKYPALVAHCGAEEATRIAVASADAVEDIIAFADEHRIEAEIHHDGWLWTSTAPDQDGSWDQTLAALADVPQNPLREITAGTARELAGPNARAGVLDPTAATLQPAALARGLRRVAIELGVRVHEHTPVRTITGDRPVVVGTSCGTVSAAGVVLAINAWASEFSWARRHLVMTASDNFVTEVLPEWLRSVIGATHTAVSDSRRVLNYWRSTDDGRVLFGKGGVGLGYRSRGASSMFGPVPRPAILRRSFNLLFPQLVSTAVTSWRAPVEYSVNSLPFFTAVPSHPRVFVGTGYSGDGVGPSRVGGRILASLVTDTADEWSGCGLTRTPSGPWLPPEPARFVGGQLVRAALLRSDSARDAGRRIDPATNLATRLDPTSWL